MSAEEQNLSFEDAMTGLENLVRELEAGKIKLDDAVEAFEKAVKLKNLCEQKLQDAKLKIEKITISSSGEVLTQPLDKQDE